MTNNTIIQGDCIQIIKEKIEKESIDLIFADPPYNLSGNGLKWTGNKTGGDWAMVNEHWDKMSSEDYLSFTKQWIYECKNVLKPQGSFFIACSYHNLSEIMITLKLFDFKINNIITWYKINAMPNMTKRVFTHSTEFVVWGVKGPGWTFNYEVVKGLNPEKQKDGTLKQMRDLWQMPLVQGKERLRASDGKALHPTQKPEELLKRIVLACSNEGDVVLDPFSGSGTTAYIAQKYNRKWIGIEKEEKYIKASLERLKSM